MDHLNFECLVKAEGILAYIKMYVKFKDKTKMLYHLQGLAEVEISSDVGSFLTEVTFTITPFIEM